MRKGRVPYALQTASCKMANCTGCDPLAFGFASDGVPCNTIASFYFKRYAQICHNEGYKMRE